MGDEKRILKFNKELYSKTSLIKAAYNYTDTCYVYLDADDSFYYVSLETKMNSELPTEKEFINEMLVQSVRHEIYKQTKSIRELLLARAMATSVIVNEGVIEDSYEEENSFSENDVLKDWFDTNDKNTN